MSRRQIAKFLGRSHQTINTEVKIAQKYIAVSIFKLKNQNCKMKLATSGKKFSH